MASAKRVALLQALTAAGAVAVIASGAVVIATSESSTARRSATLDVIEGNVEGRPAGATTFRTAPDGVTIGAGDAVRTGDDSAAEISYAVGIVTRLDASTTVQIEEMAVDRAGALITVLQPLGRAYHSFESAERSEDTFRVITPTSIVSLDGSALMITVDAGGSTVYWALDGDLSVLTLGGSLPVDEGHGVVVSSVAAVGRPFPLTTVHVADPWLQNARCETDPAGGETCPPAEAPATVTPGATPPGVVPPTPAPTLPPGAAPTPPEVTPSPTPPRDRPGRPTPTPPPDVAPQTVPQTHITAAPDRRTREADATFAFRSTPGGASFQCRLDGGSWRGCGSPQLYGPLGEGTHLFKVRGLSSRGRADPTPAAHTWTIDRTRPDTVIEDGPPSTTSDAQVTFRFRATERATFECSLDGGRFTPCSSPKSYVVQAAGTHTFQVRATDRVGNREVTPAARTWYKT